MFVHLHTHSLYSPMSGVSSLEQVCEAAVQQDADTLALTDTNGLYGAIRFLSVAREAGLRPILGAELTAVNDPLHSTHCSRGAMGTPATATRRAVLLAKTPEGYGNLCRLLSERHCLDAGFDLIQTVARYRQGLIILSDDPQALLTWRQESTQDLYVELTPGAMMHEALAVSRRSHLPPVATTRAQFVDPRQFAVHRMLRAIALNTTLSRLPPEACCAPHHWLVPPGKLAEQYPHVPEAFANTRRIADACHTDWDFKETIFPAFRQWSTRQAFETLHKKTYDGAVWRYGTISIAVRHRIEHELRIIREKGYAHYFLVVDEIVRQAPRTCGRGSAAASIVSYCLGITHVDPIRHRLFFERFLNPGRHDPPDIDIDFPWDERDRIVDWVFAQYGAQRAAMVANQNTLGIRASIREVAKVYGMPTAEIGRVAPRLLREIDFLWFEDAPTPAEWAVRLTRTLALRDPWPEILRMAVQVESHFRHLSLHCGGIVIVPEEIRRYVPVEISAKGLPAIQWEKDQTEEAGLVKIDLLGNRSLAVIRDALAAIAKHTGREIDYATWDPLPDTTTQAMIRKADTIGCFYIESPATRLLLTKLWQGMPADRLVQADVFEYLVIVSSLVRPAANPFIQEFIRRAHGAPHSPLHPLVEEVLAETHGIMVYQEDVTKVAMAVAGFSLDDADQLRKVLSKKHKQRRLQDYRAQFFREAAARGVSPMAITTLWEMIMSFAGYSFCKPHSASYAQVSFKCAWLRAYYPAEFIAAVISNQGGFYSTFAYLSEARRMGLTILPPDLNTSEWGYTGSGKTIRVGLMQLKGFSQTLAERLTTERMRHGPFRSFQDFLARVNPDVSQARLLVRAGCCDSIAGELTRPALLWRLYASEPSQSSGTRCPEIATGANNDHSQQDIAAPEGSRLTPGAHLQSPEQVGGPSRFTALPVPDEYSEQQRMQHESETFGFPLSHHPLELCHIERMDYVKANEMALHVGKEVTMIGWLITGKVVETKHGEPMEFISFEDLTGMYEATFFPESYRRFCHLFSTDCGYALRGVVEQEFGAVTLTVNDLQILPATPTEVDRSSRPGTGRSRRAVSDLTQDSCPFSGN
jgi:error-prone DNA polymerase